MGSCREIMQRSSTWSSNNFPKKLCKNRFTRCKSLYRKDLFGHFGCVNAIEFSKDGCWLASGGDDRRVLLWDHNKATRHEKCKPILMKTEHQSNIFCTVFDNSAEHIFSAGNDDKVIRHDLNRQEAIGHFHHDEPVYCISLPSEDENLFATAGEGGAVLLWDVRIPEENKLCLSMSSSSFHGVSFNPYESRLVATANAHDGVILFDLRYPERPVINYGSPGRRGSAMFAKFNQLGTQILALMRRTGPLLYNIHERKAVVEFSHTDYSNVCTMKSPCFVGDADQYIASGSDDFNIYIWENPGNDWNDTVVKEPSMVLEGHRSIVNQVRYNHHAQAMASSGVEKVVKLWSQFKMQGCQGSITEQETIPKRTLYSHEQYMQFIVESGEPLSHDYDTQSIEEDPRMIAFFDSLIQRVNAGWFTDDSSDEESPIDDILLRLVNERNEENVERNVTIMELRRLFRSNRRMLMDQLEDLEDNRWSYSSNFEISSLAGSGSEDSTLSPIGLENLEGLFGLSQETDMASDTDLENVHASGRYSDSEEEPCEAERTLTRTLSGGSLTGIVTTEFPEANNYSSDLIPGSSDSILGNRETLPVHSDTLPGSSKDNTCDGLRYSEETGKHVNRDTTADKDHLSFRCNNRRQDNECNSANVHISTSRKTEHHHETSNLPPKRRRNESNQNDFHNKNNMSENAICDCNQNAQKGNLYCRLDIRKYSDHPDITETIGSDGLDANEGARITKSWISSSENTSNNCRMVNSGNSSTETTSNNCAKVNSGNSSKETMSNNCAKVNSGNSTSENTSNNCAKVNRKFNENLYFRETDGHENFCVDSAVNTALRKSSSDNSSDCEPNEHPETGAEEHQRFKKSKGYQKRKYRKQRKK